MTKKWDSHKTSIISLYKAQNKSLNEVKQIMKDHYGFDASYVSHMSSQQPLAIS